MSFFQKIYEIVKKIPCGKVMTYGQIATLCGNPGASRIVGYALHSNPNPKEIPCHRVVNRLGCLSGGFAFGGIEVQKALLEEEGVFTDEELRVDLQKYQYRDEDNITL